MEVLSTERKQAARLSPIDRSRILWAATTLYMRGEISSEEFDKTERLYALDNPHHTHFLRACIPFSKRNQKNEYDELVEKLLASLSSKHS